MEKEECYICGNVITRDFRGVDIYCAGCGQLDDNYNENMKLYCKKCNCTCGTHPCKHTTNQQLKEK